MWPKGIFLIPLTLTDQLTHAKNTHTLDFKIVEPTSPYNIIFGRSAMKKFETIASTIHGVVRLKTLDRYGMIHINPLAIPMEMVIEEVKTTTQGGKQAHNETKEVIIHNWYVDQGVQIGEGLSRKLKEALTQLLKESANVFI